jgi:hypothetical protein
MTLELNIVHKWPTALNNGDADQLVALAHQDVEVGGPRGTTSGRQVIGEWFGRANVRLNPRRFYNRKGLLWLKSWESGSIRTRAKLLTVRMLLRFLLLATALSRVSCGMLTWKRLSKRPAWTNRTKYSWITEHYPAAMRAFATSLAVSSGFSLRRYLLILMGAGRSLAGTSLSTMAMALLPAPSAAPSSKNRLEE